MSNVTTGLQSSLITAPAGGLCSGMQVLLFEQTATAPPMWVCACTELKVWQLSYFSANWFFVVCFDSLRI